MGDLLSCVAYFVVPTKMYLMNYANQVYLKKGKTGLRIAK
jgi:hypothetical protein